MPEEDFEFVDSMVQFIDSKTGLISDKAEQWGREYSERYKTLGLLDEPIVTPKRVYRHAKKSGTLSR